VSRIYDPAAVLSPERLRGVLFTDLDGTLLDFDTFLPSPPAILAVKELLDAGIVTVPVTSKTLSEVELLTAILPLAPIAAAEGGAVLYEAANGPRLLGAPRSELIDLLRTLQNDGWPIRGLSEMKAGEVGAITGLSPSASKRALERLASEPFTFTSNRHSEEAILSRRVGELGGNLVRGGRLWHLLGGGIDKGTAVEAVRACIPMVSSVPAAAVGDAWNDLEMLCKVEHRFLLGGAVAEGELPCAIERITERGPAGFAAAARRFRVRLVGGPS